ncbi:type II toxin-antitoxin system ParD family antitoxin [Corynebacterium phoceense]|uniref:type II toxin-antitoxin system ParD family antitoxin n=1 Tax=Corynebacterium phoceense TaxID=1686286 RepID=UPI00211C9F5E|nr:type II toxin-antitoxin system ParD family antitoxin [Corynebacterium phoceense]MCQ9333566.1 type II toxin-antitoxin system ParD family antitoxin [Corynebacterium phoceense]
MSITLDEHLAEFVSAQVDSGRFASTDEAIHAGLRLVESRERANRKIRNAINAGEASGIAKGFDIDDYLTQRLSAEGLAQR